MSVVNTLQARLADMRPSEADVARRLIRNLPAVAEKSLREIAAACETSDATVMRACRAAGYDGFQDLKYNVLRELTRGTPLHAGAPVEDHFYQADIRASLEAVAPSLPKAARLLRQARRVLIVGSGASHGIGIVFTDILFTIGKQALTALDAQSAGFALTPPTEDLLVLAISHSGETQFPLRVVQDARRLSVPTIALTNEPGSELARAVDVVLPTQTVEHPAGSFAIGPRICQLAVIDRWLIELQQLENAGRKSKPRKSP